MAVKDFIKTFERIKVMSSRFLDKRIAWNLKSEIQKFPIPKECDKIKRGFKTSCVLF
jgi:hypothetical protein